eukprot:4553455-Prymnesium_polylepis.1
MAKALAASEAKLGNMAADLEDVRGEAQRERTRADSAEALLRDLGKMPPQAAPRDRHGGFPRRLMLWRRGR